MNRILIAIVFISLFCSCAKQQEQEVLIDSLSLEPIETYKSNKFTNPFFSQKHFGYHEFFKDNYGKHIKDSAKLFYSSEVIVIEDNRNSFLRTCNSFQANDSLKLVFSDTPFIENPIVELVIINYKNKFECSFKQLFITHDSCDREPTFKIIDQAILFDKEIYKHGEEIKGKLSLSVLASYPFCDRKAIVDTINIYGLVRTIVQ